MTYYASPCLRLHAVPVYRGASLARGCQIPQNRGTFWQLKLPLLQVERHHGLSLSTTYRDCQARDRAGLHLSTDTYAQCCATVFPGNMYITYVGVIVNGACQCICACMYAQRGQGLPLGRALCQAGLEQKIQASCAPPSREILASLAPP